LKILLDKEDSKVILWMTVVRGGLSRLEFSKVILHNCLYQRF
jgi:hypothetical protein